MHFQARHRPFVMNIPSVLLAFVVLLNVVNSTLVDKLRLREVVVAACKAVTYHLLYVFMFFVGHAGNRIN